ncbi:hypothetical protein Tco_0931630, partial [Tanacetum coccineum]
VLERFNTTAGNPVKKILLKLNLSDHRSILTDSKFSYIPPKSATWTGYGSAGYALFVAVYDGLEVVPILTISEDVSSSYNFNHNKRQDENQLTSDGEACLAFDNRYVKRCDLDCGTGLSEVNVATSSQAADVHLEQVVRIICSALMRGLKMWNQAALKFKVVIMRCIEATCLQTYNMHFPTMQSKKEILFAYRNSV